MLREGERLEWAHVRTIKDEVRGIGWSTSRLTNEAVNLNSFSKMRINLMEKVMQANHNLHSGE